MFFLVPSKTFIRQNWRRAKFGKFAHNGPNLDPSHSFLSVAGTQTPACVALLVEIPALWNRVNSVKVFRGIT
jgi:hypothetical protein